ncbi:hypothetical protein JR316_0005261 [Psilocybe cubensis]|uniref:Uncharacterized protein n=1 Tax=Psilocybe cubensis TaxID=181762 RepID=A0ACB8H5G0_PSICU|nr:hypothetical protein JR316_0005261 [Psilocybe cubensis]KAH9483158.1 hypothetical protein JR316_0005261 [Psilocybe cubensis]
MPFPLVLQRSFSSQLKTISSPSKRTVEIEASTLIREDHSVRHVSTALFDVLPTELKVEIFLYCLPVLPTFHPDEAPVALTRVCRSWNSLVLSTPRLWSSFSISIEGAGAAAAARDIQLMDNVKRWLDRSNPYPLHIRLTHIAQPHLRDNESHRSGQILSLLITHVHRWKHVEFFIPSGTSYVLLRLGAHQLPALKSLSLRTYGSFGSLGLLQFPLYRIPWSQISAVTLQLEQTLMSIEHCLHILGQAGGLQECSLNVNCTTPKCDTPLYPVVLPSLKTLGLTLRRGAMVNLVHFLAAVESPNLQELHIGWFVPTAQSPTTNFHDLLPFFTRFSHSLSQLTIAYLPLSTQQLHAILYQLPNITHLTLKYPLDDPSQDPITDEFFSAGTFTTPSTEATAESPTEFLLPRLKHCNLECHGAGYTSAALVAFLRSRTCQNYDIDPSTVLHRMSVMKSFRILSMKVILDAVQALNTQWRVEGKNISIDTLTVR